MTKPSPVLASYAFARSGELRGWMEAIADTGCTELLVDSGAFSAYHAGKTLDIVAYEEFCRRFHGRPGTYGYIQMDVPSKWDETRRNLEHMLAAQLKPMPVLTVDAPIEGVRELVTINARMCLAGGRGVFKGQKEWFSQRCLFAKSLTGEASRLHGLAFLRWPLSMRVGLSSADSASCAYGQSAGLWRIFTPSGMEAVSSKKLRGKRLSELPANVRAYLDACRVSSKDWSDEVLMTRGVGCFADFAAHYGHITMSAFARSRGFLAFQACGPSRITHAACVCKHGRADGKGFDYPAARAEWKRLMAYKTVERVKEGARLMEECK